MLLFRALLIRLPRNENYTFPKLKYGKLVIDLLFLSNSLEFGKLNYTKHNHIILSMPDISNLNISSCILTNLFPIHF
jgi:hypothetical protein